MSECAGHSLPKLPPLSIQISLGINSFCDWCGVAVDKRSKRCRKCHLMWLAIDRFPPHKRGFKSCRDCGIGTSRRRRLGQRNGGRCRACYFQSRRQPKNTDYDLEQKMRRAVDRPRCGTYYRDKDGVEHWASDETMLGGTFTVAAGWASLRKCWKGYRIALSWGDEDGRRLYAGRIVFLCHLLRLESPYFDELA